MKMRPFMRYLQRKTLIDPLHDFQEWQRRRPHIKRLTVEELSPRVQPPPNPFQPLPIPAWVQEAVHRYEDSSTVDTIKCEAMPPYQQGSTWVSIDVAKQDTIEMPAIPLPQTGRHPVLSSPLPTQESATPSRSKITNPLPYPHITAPLHAIHLEHEDTHSTGHIQAVPRTSQDTQPIVNEEIHWHLLKRIHQAIEEFRMAHHGEIPDCIHLSKFNYAMMCLMQQEQYFYRGRGIPLADDKDLSFAITNDEVMCRR